MGRGGRRLLFLSPCHSLRPLSLPTQKSRGALARGPVPQARPLLGRLQPASAQHAGGHCPVLPAVSSSTFQAQVLSAERPRHPSWGLLLLPWLQPPDLSRSFSCVPSLPSKPPRPLPPLLALLRVPGQQGAAPSQFCASPESPGTVGMIHDGGVGCPRDRTPQTRHGEDGQPCGGRTGWPLSFLAFGPHSSEEKSAGRPWRVGLVSALTGGRWSCRLQGTSPSGDGGGGLRYGWQGCPSSFPTPAGRELAGVLVLSPGGPVGGAAKSVTCPRPSQTRVLCAEPQLCKGAGQPCLPPP